MRAFFLSRELREKLLLVAFVVLGATIWASGLSRRAAGQWRSFRGTTEALAEQQLWLNRQAEIEAAAAAAVEPLDSSRTFDDVQLPAELSRIANETGLGTNATSEPVRPEHTSQFTVHTLQFRLEKVQWDQLRRFYEALSQRAPYINIELFTLAADRSRPELLNASLRVSSVEINR